MNLEQAIKTALEFEGRVFQTYRAALDAATDDVARRVYRTLCDEEKYHITYLGERLDEWKKNGKITLAELKTAIPDRTVIEREVKNLHAKVSGSSDRKLDVEIETLNRALALEVETAGFYKEMVRTLDADGRRMFERFVAIEEGHQAIVQAEIDCLSGSGFWFDTFEVSLEGG